MAQAVAPVLSYLLGVEEARPRDLDPEQLKRQIVLAARRWSSAASSRGRC